MKYLPIVLLIILSSCSHQTYKYKSIEATLDIERVTGVNLEEDDHFWSTGSDEIHTKYTLLAIDQQGNLYQRQKGHDGPTDFNYRGDSHSYYRDLTVYVPAGGQLVIGISLIEDDDHFNLSSAIDNTSFLVDIANAVSYNSKNVKLVRGLKLASRALSWASLAVTIVDVLDTNDLLLSYCVVVNADDLQKIGGKRLEKTVVKRGKNNGDRYHYEVDYSLLLEFIEGYDTKTKKPKKQRIKTPTFILSGHPFLGNNSLNKYWQKSPDQLLVKIDENNYDWGDGFTNKELAADFSIAMSPSFRMGDRSRGRFYLQGSYLRVPYLANSEKSISLERDKYFTVFNNAPPTQIQIEAIELDILRYSIAPHFKIYTETGHSVNYTIDFGGGMTNAMGKLKFHNLRLDNPNMNFTYDENTEILNSDDWMPFGFFRIGYGFIHGHKGLSINFGINVMKPNYKVSEEHYGLWTTDTNGHSLKVPLSTDDLSINYLFGLSFLF